MLSKTSQDTNENVTKPTLYEDLNGGYFSRYSHQHPPHAHVPSRFSEKRKKGVTKKKKRFLWNCFHFLSGPTQSPWSLNLWSNGNLFYKCSLFTRRWWKSVLFPLILYMIKWFKKSMKEAKVYLKIKYTHQLHTYTHTHTSHTDEIMCSLTVVTSYKHFWPYIYIYIYIYIYPPTDGKGLKGILPQLDKFCFTGGERKLWKITDVLFRVPTCCSDIYVRRKRIV